MYNGCPPAAEMFAGEVEGSHIRMAFEKLVNRLAQLADTFTVNNPHAQNSPRPTFRQIIDNEVLHFVRPKRVQVQHAVNRQLNGLVIHLEI